MPWHPNRRDPNAVLVLIPAGLNGGPGVAGANTGATWGRKGFSWCHIKRGVIRTSRSAWMGGSVLPYRGLPWKTSRSPPHLGLGSQAPPEPHRGVQPCLSLLPGGIQCLSQPRRHPPKRLFLHVLMGLGGGDGAATAEPCRGLGSWGCCLEAAAAS